MTWLAGLPDFAPLATVSPCSRPLGVPVQSAFAALPKMPAVRYDMPAMLHRTLLLSTFLTAAALAQVPDNLTAEGIPPISAELRRDAGRYMEFRRAAFMGWHPQLREMLIGTRFGETTQLHSVKMPGGARRQITFTAEPVGGGSWQPREGRCIVFGQDTGGGEFYQLHRLDADGRITLLTDGKSRNTGARWARRGGQLAYTSTRRNGRDNDIRAMNPLEPSSDRELLQVTGGGWAVLDWSHDEKRLLLGEYLSVNESRLHLLDLATGKAERMSPDDGTKTVWSGGQFAADDTTVFTVTDQGSEFQRLAVIDLKTRAVRVLTPDLRWDVEEFELSPDGRTVAVVTNEDGAGSLRLLDAATGRVTLQPKLPLCVISRLAWHENNRDLGFAMDNAQSPADAWSLDTQSGDLTRWTESETGGLDPATFPTPEIVRIESFDGTRMSGFLYRPDPKRFPGRRPCLVNIHGGPEGQSHPDFLGRWNFLPCELGIAMFFPNVRGSTGYGKTFVALDNGFRREDAVRDIGAFIAALKKDAALDPARFAVMGGSYGGYMTLASLIHHGAELRCGVDIVGISNFLTFLQNTQDYRRDLRRVEYGDERDPAMAAFLAKISPTARAAEITRPLFIVQGKNDPRVPVTEARQMAEAVRKAAGKVWYLEAADEGHGFAKKRNADFLFLSTVEFFKEHLLR